MDGAGGALREWIDGKLKSKTTAVDYTVKDNPAEMAGILRGDLQGQKLMVLPQKISIMRIRMQ